MAQITVTKAINSGYNVSFSSRTASSSIPKTNAIITQKTIAAIIAPVFFFLFLSKAVNLFLHALSKRNFAGLQKSYLFNRNRQLSQKFNFFKLTNILDCVITISILRIPFRTQETFIFIEADIFLSDTNQLFNLINFYLLTSRYIIS